MLSKSQLAFWRTAAEVLLETRIRVLVVDDFMAFQRLILWIFHDWAELKVVGQAVDGAEAIAKAQELQPDVIVLDTAYLIQMASKWLDRFARPRKMPGLSSRLRTRP